MKSFHHLLLLIVFLVLLSCPVPAGTTSTVYDQDKTILVDLSHAERVMVDGAVAPDLDRSQNNRVLNWQDWANDMRGQGYDVRTLTDGPVTAEKLAGTCLFIIAEPDMGKNGIAYFTADEAKAIAEYVDSGHALLLMGHTFLGG